jgi:hypothetical protein
MSFDPCVIYRTWRGHWKVYLRCMGHEEWEATFRTEPDALEFASGLQKRIASSHVARMYNGKVDAMRWKEPQHGL